MEVGVEFVQTWLALSAEMGDSLGFRTSMEDFSQASGAGIGIYIFTDQLDGNGFRRLVWQTIIQEEIIRGLWYPHKAIALGLKIFSTLGKIHLKEVLILLLR